MTDEIEIIELRRRSERPTPAVDPRGELDALREAMQFAWRPAGSRSLGDRWLRAGDGGEAGEADPMRPLAPPKPPAPPPGLGRRLRKKK